MLVRLTVGDEDEVAVAQILRDVDHGGLEPATAMPRLEQRSAPDWRMRLPQIRLAAVSQTIVTRAPTRIDFGGGWTDVPPYSNEVGGFVCNVAITRFATARVFALTDGDRASRVSASRAADRAIADAAARRLGAAGVEIGLHSDFPIGAGLGGSSAASVATIAALATLQQRAVEPSELAELSRQVEIDDLGIAGGRQ